MRPAIAAIPVPDRMRQLPRDKRGYPIFFAAFIDSDGTPHFTINDEGKRNRMIADDLCSICGQKLFRGRWFCGGPLSAFHDKGMYSDMPMHDECVHYALRVCPYLAMPTYLREVGQRKADTVKAGVVTVDDTMIPDRPEVFVAVMAIAQQFVGSRVATGGAYIKPRRPYRKVEFWRHGVQLPTAEGQAIANETMARQLADRTGWKEGPEVFSP